MDRLDVRIYREFFHGKTGPPLESDIRRSYGSVARRLNIDEVTIRKRINALQQSGFLNGWRLVVNPSLLGVRWAQIWLDARSITDKNDLIKKKLSSMDRVLTMSDYFGSELTIITMYENDLVRKKQLELIAKMSNSDSLICTNIPFPECEFQLKQTDWKIIKAIQESPRQSYPEVSRKVGVSSKTVRRRLQRMIDENVLFLIPSLNPRGLDGAILTDLVVFYSNIESKPKVDNGIVTKFDEFLIRAELYDTEHGFFNLIIRNVATAREILSWVRQQPGVKNAFLELVVDRIELYESLNELLDRKLARVGANGHSLFLEQDF